MTFDWVLRIDGVNFDDTVFNTNDLSTIRGSSLCLEAFAFELEDALATALPGWGKTPADLEPLVRAAAQAVFVLKGFSEDEARAAASLVRQVLDKPYRQNTEEPPFLDWDKVQGFDTLPAQKRLEYLEMPSEHMVFVVACEAVTGTLEEAINRAAWRNKRRQMRAPNLPRYEASADGRVCPIDPMRYVSGAVGATVVGVEGQFPELYEAPVQNLGIPLVAYEASKRSSDLHTYGQDARRTLYAVRLGGARLTKLYDGGAGIFGAFDFARSFQDIVAAPPDVSVSLKGKLAFIHVDGSGFGPLRAKCELKAFADAMEAVGIGVLERLLRHFMERAEAKDSNAFGYHRTINRRVSANSRRSEEVTLLRFETLLSGGEDFVIAVPAWLGWDMAWQILGWFNELGRGAVEDRVGAQQDMVFRAGVLFCDSKTPARRAFSAVHAICDDAKPVEARREGNEPVAMIGYHICEGFDVPDADHDWAGAMRSDRMRVYRGGGGWTGARLKDRDEEETALSAAAAFRVSASDQSEVERKAAVFKAGFARSQLYRLISGLEARMHDGNPTSAELSTYLDEQLEMHDFRSDGGGMKKRTFLENLPLTADHTPQFRMKVMAELWDYIEPPGDKQQGEGQQ